MKDRTKLFAIILVIVTILVVVLTYIFSNNDKKDENRINIVTNYSNFYTVNSCLYRTITYISNKDSKNLLLLINPSYAKKNNINESNVVSLFNDIPANSSFASKKMYYEEISKNIIKYYVYGVVIEDNLYEDFEVRDKVSYPMYFIVYINRDKGIFSIEPYSGELFINGDKNEE